MATNRLVNVLFFLGITITVLIVFRAFFSDSPLVWGDAPYFYPEGLKELVSEPSVWTEWGENFGGINKFLWISPLMIIYGELHKFLGLNNDWVLRLLFYFPAIVSAVVFPLLFSRYLGLSKIVQFFSSFVYGLNTYFLLLVDGGQVGIALAYGLFPGVILFLKKLLDVAKPKDFLLALLFFNILVLADPRIAAIAVFSFVTWVLIETLSLRDLKFLKRLWKVILLLGATLILNSYWILPSIKLGENFLSSKPSGLQFVSLIHTFLLFQPHWPANEFGKVSSPFFYFAGIPILIFGGLLFKGLRKNKVYLVFAFCFLLFAFIAKGGSEPFGGLYDWVTSELPLGIAFRDSSKFFAPLILFAGILIGLTLEYLRKCLNEKNLIASFIMVVVYSYLLFLVSPALFGQLNGVLSGKNFPESFNNLHSKLLQDLNFYRTLWFPEAHPLKFYTNRHPTVEANLLVDERPFASLNVGIFDRFNFVHDSQFLDWFDLLGIKYLIFTGNQRQTILDEGQKKDWNDLLELVGNSKGLEKIDWGTTFPIYKIPEVKPKIFAVDKLIVVIGGDDIYGKLKKADLNFSVGNQGFIFLEDGKSDPRSLERIAPESAILVFNNKAETDLTMSFLRRFFVSPLGATKGISGPSRWALRSSSEYLRWKYELLVNGVDMKEFDYDKGIAFSSVPGERIYFNLNVPEDGEYIFAVRVLTKNKDELLEANLSYGISVPFNMQGQFEWYWQEATFLKKGTKRVAFKNVSGFHALNTLALIPKKDWDNAQKTSRELIGRFQTVNLDSTGVATLADLLRNGSWYKVDYQEISQTRYKISGFRKNQWVIFTDSYHPKWNLKDGSDSPVYPFYSIVNGFYTSKPGEAEIVFSGQKDVRLGMAISLVSILAILISVGIISWRGKNA